MGYKPHVSEYADEQQGNALNSICSAMLLRKATSSSNDKFMISRYTISDARDVVTDEMNAQTA